MSREAKRFTLEPQRLPSPVRDGTLQHVDPQVVELLRSAGVEPDDLLRDKGKIEQAGLTVSEAVGELLQMLSIPAVRVVRELLLSPNEKIRMETAWRIIDKMGEVKVSRAGQTINFNFTTKASNKEVTDLAIKAVEASVT